MIDPYTLQQLFVALRTDERELEQAETKAEKLRQQITSRRKEIEGQTQL